MADVKICGRRRGRLAAFGWLTDIDSGRRTVTEMPDTGRPEQYGDMKNVDSGWQRLADVKGRKDDLKLPGAIKASAKASQRSQRFTHFDRRPWLSYPKATARTPDRMPSTGSHSPM